MSQNYSLKMALFMLHKFHKTDIDKGSRRNLQEAWWLPRSRTGKTVKYMVRTVYKVKWALA